MAKPTPEIKEKLAHDKWVNAKINQVRVHECVNDAKGCIKWGSLILSRPLESPKRFNWI